MSRLRHVPFDSHQPHFRYDLVGFGPGPHKETLTLARSLGVSIITAHVVQGKSIRYRLFWISHIGSHSSGPLIISWRDSGLLGPDVVFSHCNSLAYRTSPDDEQWAALKEHKCAIASTPEDELGMAHGNPVAFDAVDRGVKCGLGIVCIAVAPNGVRVTDSTSYRMPPRSIVVTSSLKCASRFNGTEVTVNIYNVPQLKLIPILP